MSENIFCGQCGQSNPEDNRFCVKCGKPLSLSAASYKISQNDEAANSCPICKRTDQIRKLSSIKSTETRKTSGESHLSSRANIYDKDSNYIGDSRTSSSEYISATEQSELAKKVASPTMPPKPAKPNNEHPFLEKISTGFFYIFGMGVSVYVGMQFYERSSSFLQMFLGCIFGIIIAALIGAVVVYLPLALLSQPSQEQKMVYQQQLQTYEEHVAKWKLASQRWNQSYYCYRDDVVFVPGSTETADPDNTIQFCYKNI